MQNFSYHTHTNFSDGKESLENMLTQAIKVGYKKIGISDHLIIHENIKSMISWDDEKGGYNKLCFDSFEKAQNVVSANISYIRKIAKNYPIEVLVGFEVDFFNYEGWNEKFRKLVSSLNIDYLLFGNHYFSYNNEVMDIKCANFYEKRGISKKQLMSEYFANIKAAIKSGLFDFVAHLDYCKKHGFAPKEYKQYFIEIIDTLAQTNTPYELSTKGLIRVNDFYPEKWIVEELQKRNVPVVISDDAHRLVELGADFDKAEALLSELNYLNRWQEVGLPRYKRCI